MTVKRHIEHRGIVLHIYAKSIRVEGCSRILYFRHPVDENDIEAVKGILDSGISFMAHRIQIKQGELTKLIEGGL